MPEYPEDAIEYGMNRSVRHSMETDPIGAYAVSDILYELGSSSGVPASRMSGNLLTGNMTFTDIQLQVKHFTCKAKRGIRQPGGEIKLESAEISSCEYLREDQSHISFTMSSARSWMT